MKIRKLGEDFIEIYPSIKEAAASIDTKMEDWKVQMLNCEENNNKKRAFKCKWEKRDK